MCELGSLLWKFLDNNNQVLMDKLDQESLLCVVACYVVQCHISYQSIEHDQVIGLLEWCNPITKSPLPLANKLSSFILTNFLNGQTAMKSILNKNPSKISLTCKRWTGSSGNHSVLGVTTHWIDKFELKYVILAEKLIDNP